MGKREKIEITRWDPAEFLETDEDVALYLEAALEEDEPAVIAAVLGHIVRAYGVTQVARAAGLSRNCLYKALAPNGNPQLGTVLKIVHALGWAFNISRSPKVSPSLKLARKKEAKRISTPSNARVSP